MKHAPIGPTVAVGDARPDGTFFVHTHNQNPQALRGQIAMMLGTSVDNVVVRIYAGPGHYGRSNGGNAGAEDEAVILSQAVEAAGARAVDAPRRSAVVDLSRRRACRTSRSAGTRAARSPRTRPITTCRPCRTIGWSARVLAGTADAAGARSRTRPQGSISSTVNAIQDPWIYERVPNVAEIGYGTFQIGQKASPLGIGLRDHSMRTPGQLQQNFPRELAMSEAAAQAGIDAIEFRLRQTDDARLRGVLDRGARRRRAGRRARRRHRRRRQSGSTAVTGQGVSAMLRSGTYWACVCQVSVAPSTGKVKVDKYTIAVDPGIVVNPLQLKRTIEGGALMGLSHALYEEMTFDESGVTSRDWRSYPILTMDDVPEVKVVILTAPGGGRIRRRIGSGQCAGGVGNCRSLLRRDRQERAPAAAEAGVRAVTVEGVATQEP